MENIEKLLGYFGQMTWQLALKTLLYALVFAVIIFLQGFIPALPGDLFSVDGAALLLAAKAGLSLIYKQVLVIATPFIISIVRTDKK